MPHLWKDHRPDDRQPPCHRRQRLDARRGMMLVMMAMVMVVLLGLLGIVVDLGLMGAMSRQAQNVADAAALAAARDLLAGRSTGSAASTAQSFAKTYNSMTEASVNVSIPPATGPYAGADGYVEVSVTQTYNTAFAHIVPGISRVQTLSARAVAGYEAVAGGQGLAVFNPDAVPGLSVSNGGTIIVDGRVVVNSEGGGVDETGAALPGTGVAAKGSNPQPGKGIFANDIRVVGGVDNPASFQPYVAGDPSPLKARQTPEPDSLIELPVPTVALGVDATPRGDVHITGNASNIGTGNIVVTTSASSVIKPGDSLAGGLYTARADDVILYPGIYDAITINNYSGRILLIPGIFVISAKTSNALTITGGTVIAQGVMFYNTGSNFNPVTGTPDVGDKNVRPPISDNATLGDFTLNQAVTFTPIDTHRYNYASMYQGAPAVNAAFDGMLFFQRRGSQRQLSFQGNSASGVLEGTLYAKWANAAISGQGTYDAQIIVGSISVSGTGFVTIQSAGGGRGRANDVYLVE